jgi:hypothetical protein
MNERPDFTNCDKPERKDPRESPAQPKLTLSLPDGPGLAITETESASPKASPDRQDVKLKPGVRIGNFYKVCRC